MKNEKVALVIFAYIIGFTTAFIAFAINDKSQSGSDLVILNDDQEAGVYADGIQTNSEVELLNNADGLFILKDGNERILSAVATDGMSGEGFHTEVFSSVVSPNGQYVHFCASLVGETGVCTNFVYSVGDDMVYKVRVGDELLRIGKEETAEVSWVKEDTLRFKEGMAAAAANWSIR